MPSACSSSSAVPQADDEAERLPGVVDGTALVVDEPGVETDPLNDSNVRSVGTEEAFFGQATQSPPACARRRASGVKDRVNSP